MGAGVTQLPDVEVGTIGPAMIWNSPLMRRPAVPSEPSAALGRVSLRE